MALQAVYIVLFTLFAASCWHLIYRWFVNEGATIYESLMLTSVFQAIICTACFFSDLKNGVTSTEIRENNQLEQLYLISAAGFFFHDTPHWQARHTLTSYTLLLHHIVAFVYLLATLFYGKGGSIAVQISFYMEVTTPLLALRHYLRKFQSKACKCVELLFAVLFVSLRFWLGADIMLSILQEESVPLGFKVGIFIIYFMSCGLLPGVLRMLLSANGKPDRNRSRRQSSIVRHSFVASISRPSSSRRKSRDGLFSTKM